MSPGDVRYEVVLGDELPAEALTWADKMLAESPFAPRMLNHSLNAATGSIALRVLTGVSMTHVSGLAW